jgi:hypothetical protein
VPARKSTRKSTKGTTRKAARKTTSSKTTARKKTTSKTTARKKTTRGAAAKPRTAKKRVAAPKKAVLERMTVTAPVARTVQRRMAKSAAEELGPHLLGRKKPRADRRDFQMRDFLSGTKTLTTSFTPTTTLQDLADNPAFDFWSIFPEWNFIKGLRAAAPPAPPTVTKKEWELLIQLDQGQTGHCVGFGSAGWGNSAPIEDSYQNADGHKIYYLAKVIDGEPGQENGSSVHSGVKALKQMGRVASYYFGTTVDTLKQWVLEQNPVICGTDWFNDMFNPDADGVVVPTGGVAGGHCYLMLGYDTSTDLFEFDNSWGPTWGKKGRFYMHASDVEKLLNRPGAEYCGAVELPLAAAPRR